MKRFQESAKLKVGQKGWKLTEDAAKRIAEQKSKLSAASSPEKPPSGTQAAGAPEEKKTATSGAAVPERSHDRGKRPDDIATDIVTTFFRREGKERFGIAEPEKELRVGRVTPDPDFPNRRIVTVTQTVHGIPVFGARAIAEVSPQEDVVALTNGLVRSERVIEVTTIPDITKTQAIERALESYRYSRKPRPSQKTKDEQESPKIELTIFDPTVLKLKPDRARLAWQVRVDSFVVFIDAQSGSPIFQYDDMQSAFQGRRTYDVDGGEQDECGENLVLDENGPHPGAKPVSPDPDTNAKMAHEEAKKAYSFFKKLGWDSYDNLGSFIDSNVRVRDWLNRYGQWNPDGRFMIFYPGIPLAPDIAGHEFTHGVIQFTIPPDLTSGMPGGLIYHGESGALNEALADFFGSQIEDLNWTIGENAPIEDDDKPLPTNALPLRDMENPHKGSTSLAQCGEPAEPRTSGFYPNCPPWRWNRGQPDHYAEWVNPDQDICAYKEPDNGCIHLNSGIFNKAMYLAANGGNHHGVHVQGINKRKLARIMFRTLGKLTPASDMRTAAEASIEACTQLIGRHGLNQSRCNQLGGAFVAVGLLSP